MACAWLGPGGVLRTPGRVVQECGGLVPLHNGDDALSFAAPPLIRPGPVAGADRGVALSVLGGTPAGVVEGAWIDNGDRWLGVPLCNADVVIALESDLTLRTAHQSTGVVGLCPRNSENDGAGTEVELGMFLNDAGGPRRGAW